MRLTIVFLFIFLIPFTALSQYWPKDSAILHYRIIGFKFPADNSTDYKVEIATGYHTNPETFSKKLIKVIPTETNKVIGEVPLFGTDYTWRIVYKRSAQPDRKSDLHHFSTGAAPLLDTSYVRMRVTHKAEKYSDAYVFMDGCKALYDMEGNLVWYMPEIDSFVDSKPMVRDLKLSDKGVITFLGDRSAYAISYDGAILWRNRKAFTKATDSADIYHHELTRLSNGHYMVLGYEATTPMRRALKRDSATGRVIRDTARKARITKDMIRYGKVFEYDEQNNIKWEYHAGDYFKTQDLSAYDRPNGLPEYDPHQNSFYFDEENRIVYLGFRNLSQVLKISYPDGKVLAAYGKIIPPAFVNDLFCGQHSCKKSSDGYLYLFNNGCSVTSPPTVVMLKEPQRSRDTLEKIWEFPCPVTFRSVSPRNVPNSRAIFTSGGCATELPDQSFFVSTCNPYGLVFIVNRNKEVLWSCEAERLEKNRNLWSPLTQYRGSLIPNRKALEDLIWSSIK